MDRTAETYPEAQVARQLDSAFLKFDSAATVSALKHEVEMVQQYSFRSLCVPPVLAGTVKKNFPRVRVSAVVAYPLGEESLAAKTFAISELAEQGVDEIDFVMDLFALVNSNWAKVEQEANKLGKHCMQLKLFAKAIIETPILTNSQIRMAAEILRSSPVPCIKTSTGYHREPTSLDHVRLIHDSVGRDKMIKASGGIKTYDQVRAMVEAGASIIGTSSGVAIVKEAIASRQPVDG